MGDLLHWFFLCYPLWIKLALFSWIGPFDGSCKNSCSSRSVGYWQVLEEWVVGLCQLKGSPAFVGMCSTWTWSGREIPLRSAVAPELGYPHEAQSSLSYFCGSWLRGGCSCSRSLCAALKSSSPATLIVSSLLLGLFSCVDVLEESHWSRGFASYWSGLGGAAYLWDHCLSLSLPLSPSGWAGNGNGGPRHILTYLSKLALIQIPRGVRIWS